MLRCVKEDLRPYVKKLFQRSFRIGVGVHFGETIVGTVGGDLQERVTAIGDAVNIASRVEHANKRARTEFLVSEAVLREVQDKVRVGKSIYVRLPGKTGKYPLTKSLAFERRTAKRRSSDMCNESRMHGEASAQDLTNR